MKIHKYAGLTSPHPGQVNSPDKPSSLLVVLAFAIVYIVWGSTYFFIKIALDGFPPMIMGAFRFLTAGILLLTWCRIKGDRLWVLKDIKTSAVCGLLILFVSIGIVIWVERILPSAMVAIMVAANPVWFVILDKANWKINLRSRSTIAGIILGFSGVLLLFGEAIERSLGGSFGHARLMALLLLVINPVVWSAGSLYSKKNASNAPARVNTAWQMIIAGLVFIPASLFHHEFSTFHPGQVPARAWGALVYLILFGSIAAFSAYVWLLKIRPATQVSTHSYVNPVIAVLLGVGFSQEHISGLQFLGLLVILVSVLLVNLAKYGPAFKGAILNGWNFLKPGKKPENEEGGRLKNEEVGRSENEVIGSPQNEAPGRAIKEPVKKSSQRPYGRPEICLD